MDDSEITELADFARALADAARAVTLRAAAGSLVAENKAADGGFDPVTAADREAERAMRALIEAHFPAHGISGEEFGERVGAGEMVWSLDPIDGTLAFICALPSWTTLIALVRDGEPLIGLIDAPMLDERYLGAGGEARLVSAEGERRLATSGRARLAEARISTTDPFRFDEAEARRFARLRAAAPVARYGLDGYAYARLAAGSLDLVAETRLKPHDYQALVPVIRAAGGTIGNWRGGDDLSGGDVLAAASPALYDEAVAVLAV